MGWSRATGEDGDDEGLPVPRRQLLPPPGEETAAPSSSGFGGSGSQGAMWSPGLLGEQRPLRRFRANLDGSLPWNNPPPDDLLRPPDVHGVVVR